jgi:hypothetical protein
MIRLRLPKRPESYWRCAKCEQPLSTDGAQGYCARRKPHKGHKPVLYQPPDDRPSWIRLVEKAAYAFSGLLAVLLIAALVGVVLLAWIVIGMAIEGDGPHCSVATVSEDC